MKIYLIIIITLFVLIILPIIILYIVLYIRNRKFNNIKGYRPPEPPKENPDKPKTNPDSPETPVEPFIISAYKHTLDLTSYFLNKYVITCKFYNDKILHIDMIVFDKKGNQIATNLFDKNSWDIVSDGYQINYDYNLLNEVRNAPVVTCTLDPHIKYITGNPNKIFVKGTIKFGLQTTINEEIEQCDDINC
jgi:hypothetical protein